MKKPPIIRHLVPWIIFPVFFALAGCGAQKPETVSIPAVSESPAASESVQAPPHTPIPAAF